MVRFGTISIAALLLAMTVTPTFAADGTVSEVTRSALSPVRLQEVGTRLKQQPKRIFRLPGRADVVPAVALGRQEVISVRPRSAVAQHNLDYCTNHPLVIEAVAGSATPRGTLTISGLCFGTNGAARLIVPGLPGGSVPLTVTSWTDTAITATVPAVSGVKDETAYVRLSQRNLTGVRERVGQALPPAESAPFAVRFTAVRETVITSMSWVVNVGCGPGGQTVANLDSCDAYSLTSGAWFDTTRAAPLVYHVRRNLPPASGVDAWQTHLPVGWTFDRIEFISSTPETTVEITPTINNAAVSFRVLWKTARMVDANGPHEEAAYTMAVYATGPVGTETQ